MDSIINKFLQAVNEVVELLVQFLATRSSVTVELEADTILCQLQLESHLETDAMLRKSLS